MSHGDFAKAIDLYRGESKAPAPEGDRAHAAMVRAMLRANKLTDAAAEAHAWTTSAPTDVWSQVALDEVQWRNGVIETAHATILAANKMDGCNPQVYADYATFLLFSGLRASAETRLGLARRLDPVDDEIESEWLHLQPRSVQLPELTTYLARASFLSETERKSVERWKARLAEPQAHSCSLASTMNSTSIPFRVMQNGPLAPVLWGLDVAFEGKSRHLEIDTGASGLLITKAAALGLHLQAEEHIQSGGIGDDGEVNSFIAHVKTIKIGGLEFQDCNVEVLEKTPEAMVGQDGLIGGDVFSAFLLTLDFPGRVLKLDPLPAPPNAAILQNALDLQTGMQDTSAAVDRYIAPTMASWTRIFRTGHDLIMPTRLNGGATHLFIVDTGSALNLISPEAAREVAKVSGHGDDIYGISGQVKKTYNTGRLDLDFAGLRYPTDGMTALDMTSWGDETGVAISGFIGAPILHQLTVQIDYRDNLMHFSFDPSRLTKCVEGVRVPDCY